MLPSDFDRGKPSFGEGTRELAGVGVGLVRGLKVASLGPF
jgi:hypothetical protein